MHRTKLLSSVKPALDHRLVTKYWQFHMAQPFTTQAISSGPIDAVTRPQSREQRPGRARRISFFDVTGFRIEPSL